MSKILELCVTAIVLQQITIGVNAECCPFGFCGDCSYGNPFCGKLNNLGCNAIGCNCLGGCREGKCNGMSLDDADNFIRAADEDGNGRLSLQEVYSMWPTHHTVPKELTDFQ